jgi:hypothetical protein
MKTLHRTSSVRAAGWGLLIVAAATVAAGASSLSSKEEQKMTKDRRFVQHLAPVLIVDAVEPCVKFWVERLGFTAANEVRDPSGRLVFASVQSDAVEVMYQTKASVVAEAPDRAGELSGHSTALFFTVDDLAAVEHALADAPVVKPRHKTAYGSTEIYVREPGGNIVGFAQMGR